MGLTRDDVVDAALEVLDDAGLDAVSLRRVAERLEVRANTVAWHAGDKAALLEAMTERLMASCLTGPLPTDPEERTRALFRRFRQAMSRHRDGARLTIEGSCFTAPHKLAFTDAVSAALLETGRSPREVAWTSQTVVYFILGLVQEEQDAPGRPAEFRSATVDTSRFPAWAQIVSHLGADDFDARFEYGLDLILGDSAQRPRRVRARRRQARPRPPSG